MANDEIANMLTLIRNAIFVKHRIVNIPLSNMNKAIVQILEKESLINEYKIVENEDKKNFLIEIKLKSSNDKPSSSIKELKRVSKSGIRFYTNVNELKSLSKFKNIGFFIVSTNKGVMTHKKALKANLGGEVLCYVGL